MLAARLYSLGLSRSAFVPWVLLLSSLYYFSVLRRNSAYSTSADDTKNRVTLATSLFEVAREEWGQNSCGNKRGLFISLENWIQSFHEILILADTSDVCENLPNLSSSVMCRMHTCLHPVHGRPIVRCLLQEAIRLTRNEFIMFTNSDLIYFGIQEAVRGMTRTHHEYIAIGQRYDIDFMQECEAHVHIRSVKLANILKEAQGSLHEPWGIDYILFHRSYIKLDDMPDFLIGLWKWDNWFIDTHIRHGYNVIDATQGIKAVHLQSSNGEHSQRKSSEHNKQLYMQYYNLEEPNHLLDDPFPVGLGTTQFAPFYLKDNVVTRRWCYFEPFVQQSSCDHDGW